MNSCELVASITAIACGLSKCMSTDELNVLSTALSQLGDTLATILAKEDLDNKSKENLDNKSKGDKSCCKIDT